MTRRRVARFFIAYLSDVDARRVGVAHSLRRLAPRWSVYAFKIVGETGRRAESRFAIQARRFTGSPPISGSS